MFRIQEGGEGESGRACIMPLNRRVPQGTGQLLECWESETVCHRGQLLVTCRKKEVCSPNVRRNVVFFYGMHLQQDILECEYWGLL